MTGKIFLSYRREDAAGFALALYGRLEQSFPAAHKVLPRPNAALDIHEQAFAMTSVAQHKVRTHGG